LVNAPPHAKKVGATAPKNNRRTRTISDEELRAVLDELKSRDIHACRVALFAATTGCRASEAFRLRWTDLDIGAGTAVFPKTKNSDARIVPLADELIATLSGMTPGHPTSLIFMNSEGEPYKEAPSAFRSAVDKLKLNEGREPRDRLVFHSLRHLAATRLANVLPLRALMDVMGWKVPAMALRYSHTRREDLDTTARALGSALKPATDTKVAPDA
jgi:integrase